MAYTPTRNRRQIRLNTAVPHRCSNSLWHLILRHQIRILRQDLTGAQPFSLGRKIRVRQKEKPVIR